VKSSEAKRYLQKLGGHLKVTLHGRRSVLPMHGNKELKMGTWQAIKKQLEIKEKE
jgi:predicted RNA binding protein YcfA (HicA-like mRNA interferase family)